MSEELMPCGFCEHDEARVIVVDEVTDAGCEEATVPLYAASCPYCGARGPMALSEDEAVEAWNRRAERGRYPMERSKTMTGEVHKAYEVSDGKSVGVMIPDELVDLIRDYIVGLLDDNRDKMTPIDWTINKTWKKDGEQVTCYFEQQDDSEDYKRWTLESLADERGGISIRRINFTDELGRDKVGELCGMVARGEIEVSDAD